MKSFLAAAVQLNCTDDRDRNLDQAFSLIDAAAASGAEFIALPENTDLIASHSVKVEAAEPLDGPTFRLFADKAKELDIWLLAGSLAEVSSENGKARNTSALFSPDGERVSVYRKIHLFDVDLEERSFRESSVVEAGTEVVLADTPLAVFGMSVCYDLRFPELYRRLAWEGAEVLLVPSAFTAETGKDHWEVLLRARAIENTCWLIAPAQVGDHIKGRRSYGHSMIVDPWGLVVARCSDGPGYCIAELRSDVLEKVRKTIPSLQHRVL